MIRFGGPVFDHSNSKSGKDFDKDPHAIIRECRAKGFKAAPAPKLSIDQTTEIREAREAFKEADIIIGEVGFWNNLLDLDEAKRRENRECMAEALAMADALGARCAVDIPGSYCRGHGVTAHSAKNFSEDAFAECVDMARYFIDTVKPKTAYFAYEIFPFCVVDSPDSIERLIKAVDRERFGVHLDLANMINNPRVYWKNGELVRECVRRFGDRIVSAHVKDIKLEEPALSVCLREVMPGTGGLDMKTFVREMNGLSQEVPFIMEHLNTEEEYDRAAKYIRDCAAAVGVEI